MKVNCGNSHVKLLKSNTTWTMKVPTITLTISRCEKTNLSWRRQISRPGVWWSQHKDSNVLVNQTQSSVLPIRRPVHVSSLPVLAMKRYDPCCGAFVVAGLRVNVCHGLQTCCDICKCGHTLAGVFRTTACAHLQMCKNNLQMWRRSRVCWRVSARARVSVAESSAYFAVKAKPSKEILSCRSGGHVTCCCLAQRPLGLWPMIRL